jgi:hypothetical protein
VEEVFNGGKMEVVDELLSEGFVRIAPSRATSLSGREAFKQYVTDLRTAYPDMELSITSMTSVGETVVLGWRFLGTNTGPGSYPPTGKRLDLRGTSHSTYQDGKMTVQRVSWDDLGAGVQLGLPPMPSIEGAWQRTRVSYSNPDTSWVREDYQSNLLIISKAHYSTMRVLGREPRKLFKERRSPTDEEKLEAYNSFVGNSGTYETSGDSITFRPVVARNPNTMAGVSWTAMFSVSPGSLRLTFSGKMRQDTTKTYVSRVDLKRVE